MAQVRDRSGKVKTASFAKRESAEAFEAHEKEKRRLQKKGLRAPRDGILFVDALAAYFKRRLNSNLTYASFVQDNSKARNTWIPAIGTMPLEFITTADILEVLDGLEVSIAHRNRHRAMIHKFFEDAFMRNLIDANPVSRIRLVPEPKVLRVPVPTPDQDAYIDALARGLPRYWMLGMLMVHTGARICSCNVLRYGDIDWDAGVIGFRRIEERASRTVQERQKGKGDGGENVVPLFPVLRTAILSHRRSAIHRADSDYIACRPDGSYIPYDSFKGAHRAALEAAKLGAFTPHDLRRAFATNAKRAGYTRSEIREMLGHSSDLVTARYDLKDIEHLVTKGKRLGFGKPVRQKESRRA